MTRRLVGDGVVAIGLVSMVFGLASQATAECPTPSAPSCADVPPVPSPGQNTDDPAGAAALLVLANQERAAAGLSALTPRGDVGEIAQAHSRAMAAKGAIWHNDAFFSAAAKARLGALVVGENVAVNTSLVDAHSRLMASPGHRANILDVRFTVAGFAVTRAGDGQNYITQDFLQPRSEPPPPRQSLLGPTSAVERSPSRKAPTRPAQVRPPATPPTTTATVASIPVAPVPSELSAADPTGRLLLTSDAGPPDWLLAVAGAALWAAIGRLFRSRHALTRKLH